MPFERYLFSLRTLGIIYTALSGIAFGTIGYFGMKIFDTGISVYNMLFWRFLIASLFMAIVAAPSIKRHRKSLIKMGGYSFFIGATFYAFATALFFYATLAIGTSLAMVIFYAFPLAVVGLSWVLNKTALNFRTFISIICVMLGVWLLAEASTHHSNLTGISLSVAAAFLYGVYFFLSQRSGSKIDPTYSTLWVCLGNSFTFLIASLANDTLLMPHTVEAWENIIGISIVGTALALWFLFKGLKLISATHASIISALEPLVGVLLGVWLLHEKLNHSQYIGCLIILIAVLIIHFDNGHGRKSKK